jgi:hypothetical protein
MRRGAPITCSSGRPNDASAIMLNAMCVMPMSDPGIAIGWWMSADVSIRHGSKGAPPDGRE